MNLHSFDSNFWKKVMQDDLHLIREWGPVFVIVVFSLALIDSLGQYSIPILLMGLGSLVVIYAWKESLEIQRKYLEEQRKELKAKLDELEREIHAGKK